MPAAFAVHDLGSRTGPLDEGGDARGTRRQARNKAEDLKGRPRKGSAGPAITGNCRPRSRPTRPRRLEAGRSGRLQGLMILTQPATHPRPWSSRQQRAGRSKLLFPNDAVLWLDEPGSLRSVIVRPWHGVVQQVEMAPPSGTPGRVLTLQPPGEQGDRHRHQRDHRRPHHRGPRPAGPPGPPGHPIWLTILIGIAAAIVGTLLATALGVGSTRGIDWIELIIQIALAAAGVALVAGRYAPGRRHP